MMLASANQRFEGARICRGSSIAAYYYVVEGSPSTRMLSRLRQVNHCYLLVSTPKGYVDFLSRGLHDKLRRVASNQEYRLVPKTKVPTSQ